MTQEANTVVNITKSQIIADLNAGLTRKQIFTKYGQSAAVGKSMINTFGLKNAKRKGAKSGVSFNFVDDTSEGVNAAAEAAVASIEAPVTSDDLY